MRYVYICTNFNNSHHSVRAVETLNLNCFKPECIVIVDNASEESERNILRMLEAQHDNVTVIYNAVNVGYFSGLNVGIAHVRERFSDIDGWIVGNNDLEFGPEFAAQLEGVLSEGSHRPVISPYVETLDGLPQNPHVVSGISRARELVYDAYYSNYALASIIMKIARRSGKLGGRDDEEGFAQEQYIYQGHGSCYVLTRSFFENFDELWAPTFMMGEEFFLSKQLEDKGFMTFYDPRIRVRHRCNGAIQNVGKEKMWRLAADAHKVYRRYVSRWRRQDHSGLARQLEALDRQRSAALRSPAHSGPQ